jgi:hypothetical protein
MYYRLYLLNAAQRLAARNQFEAENDETAITIAGLQTLAERAPRGPGRKETAFEQPSLAGFQPCSGIPGAELAVLIPWTYRHAKRARNEPGRPDEPNGGRAAAQCSCLRLLVGIGTAQQSR